MLSESDALKLVRHVSFLHQEALNNELYCFLADLGYPVDRIKFIRAHPRVFPIGGQTRSLDSRWDS